MSVDFNKPDNSSAYTTYLGEIRDAIAAVGKMAYSGASNIFANAIQWNNTTKNFEREASGTFVSQGGPVPPGGMIDWGSNSAPTGWMICDGSAISRSTYADMFGNISTTYGVGNGTTTFNIPDFRQKFALYKAASGTGSTLGGTGGAIDHTHTVPAHYHAMGTGADLNITSGGAHTHSIDHDHGSVTSAGVSATHTHAIDHNHAAFTSASGDAISNYHIHSTAGGSTTSGDFVGYSGGFSTITDAQWPGAGHTHSIDVPNFTGSSGTESADHTHAVDLPNFTGTSGSTSHTHTAGTFSGRIGLVTSGVDGNSAMTSGTNNPPFLVVNKIIKI